MKGHDGFYISTQVIKGKSPTFHSNILQPVSIVLWINKDKFIIYLLCWSKKGSSLYFQLRQRFIVLKMAYQTMCALYLCNLMSEQHFITIWQLHAPNWKKPRFLQMIWVQSSKSFFTQKILARCLTLSFTANFWEKH